ncbi:MAG: NUDIX hydrolase [Candidatus Acidiferrales bacterium]
MTEAGSVREGREYPERPVVGVGGVVVRDGAVLLVKRAAEPLRGRWSLPGGAVELGESLEEAVARELKEETGLTVRVLGLVEAFDRITRDTDGRARYHYVLLDFLCEPLEGDPVAASDVDAVAWARPEEFAAYELGPHAQRVCEKALAMARSLRIS